jgi:hypothetical protein
LSGDREVWRGRDGPVREAVIGKPLDQLRIEGWNSYTCVDRDEAAALLERFYGKTDAGRAGANPTPLDT